MSRGLRFNQRISQRNRYRNKEYIKKICKCPCKEMFYTKTEKTEFKGMAHYLRWKALKGITWKRKPVYRVNKIYKEKPCLIKTTYPMKIINLFLILAVFLIALPFVNANAKNSNITFQADSELRAGFTCTRTTGKLNCTNGQLAYLANESINITGNTNSVTTEFVFEAVSGTLNQFGGGFKAGNASTACGNDEETLGIRNEGGSAIFYHDGAPTPPAKVTLFTIGDGLKHRVKVSTLLNASWNVTLDGNYLGNVRHTTLLQGNLSWMVLGCQGQTWSTVWYEVSNYNGTTTPIQEVADTTPPIVNVTINNTSPKINEWINISANITDETGLLFANWSINFSTGLIKQNYSISGTSFKFSNRTQITDGRGNVLNITVYATDTNNNVKINSTIITIGDTLGSIFIGINNTSPKINDVINISGNATDIDADFSLGYISYNVSGNPQRNFSFAISGTKGNFSQAITINLTRGNIINFTVFYNDTAGTIFQNSTLVTVADTQITFTSFANTTDLTFNKNQTINWSCSDADVPPDTITSNAYFERVNPPTVQIATNIVDFNITTNMTTEGKYFLNATCTSNGVTAYSTIFNITLDVSTPTCTNIPTNNTFYNKDFNISTTCTDNLQLFEINSSIRNVAGNVIYNSTNITNLTTSSYIFNTSIKVTELGDAQYNFTQWVGDTKNKDLPIDYVKTGFNNISQQFNDTTSGLQMNLTYGLWLPNNVFLTINENDLIFNKKSSITNVMKDNVVEHFKTEYNVTLPSLSVLQLINSLLTYTNINFSIQIKTNAPIIEVNDGLANHLLIGSGKNRLSFDAQDLIEQGFSNTKFYNVGGALYLVIPPKNLSYASGISITFDPRIDNLNIIEYSSIIEVDTINPTFNSLNLTRNGLVGNNTFISASTLNFTYNVSDKNNNSILAYVSNAKNITAGYISNSSQNITIRFADGNYTLLLEINDSAGNKINGSYLLGFVVDTKAPTFVSAFNRTADSSNSTSITTSTNVNISAFGVDDLYLKEGNFSHNASGSWTNQSILIKGNQTPYHYVIGSGNFTAGQVVGWKFYIYDIAGNELDPIYTFTINNPPSTSITSSPTGSSGGSISLSSLTVEEILKITKQYFINSSCSIQVIPKSIILNNDNKKDTVQIRYLDTKVISFDNKFINIGDLKSAIPYIEKSQTTIELYEKLNISISLKENYNLNENSFAGLLLNFSTCGSHVVPITIEGEELQGKGFTLDIIINYIKRIFSSEFLNKIKFFMKNIIINIIDITEEIVK